jgi:hypothetical protein
MIRIKELFKAAGLDEIRPTDDALEAMGMSRRRFTQIADGSNKSDITLTEIMAIKKWLSKIREIDPDQVLTE